MPAEMGFDYMGMFIKSRRHARGPGFGHLRLSRCCSYSLILAALYESWSLPFSVLLSTPVAVFGAFGVLWLRRAVLSVLYPAYMCKSKTMCTRKSGW